MTKDTIKIESIDSDLNSNTNTVPPSQLIKPVIFSIFFPVFFMANHLLGLGLNLDLLPPIFFGALNTWNQFNTIAVVITNTIFSFILVDLILEKWTEEKKNYIENDDLKSIEISSKLVDKNMKIDDNKQIEKSILDTTPMDQDNTQIMGDNDEGAHLEYN